jgi:hypothetical protein
VQLDIRCRTDRGPHCGLTIGAHARPLRYTPNPPNFAQRGIQQFSMASKSFAEALESSSERCRRGQDVGGDGGPWDELASYYWGLWNELEADVLPETPDRSTQPTINPNADQRIDNAISEIRDQVHLHAPQGIPYADEKPILGLESGLIDLPEIDLPDEIFDIPPKTFRDELVCLYFKHIHPLCPVFDEVEFHTTYYAEGGDLAFLQSFSLVEFRALLFAGALVSSCRVQFINRATS